MNATARRPADDPLHIYDDGLVVKGRETPVPLVATRFAVTITGPVVAVRTWRSFRNVEARSIEVTLTMPMPVRSVLHALEADIGGRVLKGMAQARRAARETYEAAIDEGQLAVLHEEVLCGIHMVSIAHLPPGAEVTIQCAWAALATPDGTGRAGLRIPLTVGDVYGRSPLSDADDLLTGGPRTYGTLTIDADHPDVAANGRSGVGTSEVPLDRPIDISIALRSWPRLSARASDGRRISMAVAPTRAGDAAIDAIALIDKSGSMNSVCSSRHDGRTKFSAVEAGLAAAADTLRAADRLRFLAFDTEVTDLGLVPNRSDCTRAFTAMGRPDGGTELGRALEAAISGSAARDILLLTDGQSHALDVPALVRSGRRFSVVLIGEDSLEARVGHLAALSGGALVVARGPALAEAVATAFAALRHPHVVRPAIDGVPSRVTACQDGLDLDVRWDDGEATEGIVSDAVRALASALAVARLPEARATDLAVAEGLVGPLTSLVLVDVAGTPQEGLPAVRKVALPAPAAAAAWASPSVASAPFAPPAPAASPAPMPSARPSASPAPRTARSLQPAPLPAPASPRAPLPAPGAASRSAAASPLRSGAWRAWWVGLSGGGRGTRPQVPPLPDAPSGTEGPGWLAIEPALWIAHGSDLARGDLDALPPALAARLRTLAEPVEIARAAAALRLTPVQIVIGLLARRLEATDRAAARVARAIFKGLTAAECDAALADLPSPEDLQIPAFLRRTSAG